MKELGEYLKETRENNGVSIDEAADDLNIDSFLLENLEEGNVRAFRDVLSMKEKVKEYAKYLGLDPENVADEFNDFLFEHTSKISLSDILEAEKKSKSKKTDNANTKKISSPYTIVKQKKINKRVVYTFLGALVLFILFLLLIINIMRPKEEKITNELLEKKASDEKYEFTY